MQIIFRAIVKQYINWIGEPFVSFIQQGTSRICLITHLDKYASGTFLWYFLLFALSIGRDLAFVQIVTCIFRVWLNMFTEHVASNYSYQLL